MKTSFLSQSMTDILQDDEDDLNSSEFIELSGSVNGLSESVNGLSESVSGLSDSICELLDPSKKLPPIEFEAVDTVPNNESAWNSSLNKRSEEKPTKQKRSVKVKPVEKRLELNINNAVVKPLRNPRKALSKTKSSQKYQSLNLESNELPDLETILLEKSRAVKVPEAKVEEPKEQEIKTSVDNDWLNRNSDEPQPIMQTLTSTSSFGLSNLNLTSTKSDISVENKYHSCDVSDNEYVKSAEDKSEILPISKKRKISNENEEVEAGKEVKLDNVEKIDNTIKKSYHFETDDDDSDKDPNYEQQKSPSPVAMKRKKSLIKKSKEKIDKVTKKASKLLTRGRKAAKNDQTTEEEPEEEEEINFFIDTEINNVKTVPRMSEKFLYQSEKLVENFIHQADVEAPSSSTSDFKNSIKRDALEKKIASGTLNDNFVRVNLKKKVFVKGKKSFNFSRYKKTLWKSKKQANSLDDMRGCDGGVLKCFNCNGVGHFAQQCKKKGDSLMPLDAVNEDESNLPTLQEAAQMAEEQKLLVHATKQNSIPLSSNDMWKNENSSDGAELVNKENQNLNGSQAVENSQVEKKVRDTKARTL